MHTFTKPIPFTRQETAQHTDIGPETDEFEPLLDRKETRTAKVRYRPLQGDGLISSVQYEVSTLSVDYRLPSLYDACNHADDTIFLIHYESTDIFLGPGKLFKSGSAQKTATDLKKNREKIRSQLVDIDTGTALYITMQNGYTVILCYQNLHPEKPFILLESAHEGSQVWLNIDYIKHCKPISSQLKTFLNISGHQILGFENKTLYIYDDDLSFDDWRNHFIEHIIDTENLHHEYLVQFLQLCRKEDINDIETRLAGAGLPIETFPNASELYFQAGLFSRLISNPELRTNLKLPPPLPLFPKTNLTITSFLKMCLTFKDMGILGTHLNMIRLFYTISQICHRIATYEGQKLPNVLILGEAGSGKELISGAIHKLSKRKADKFQRINCAAFPSELFESMLYGYKKGTFTGALKDTPGLLANAEKGTLQFDEIGRLSNINQPKILRLLEEREYIVVGETKTTQADVLFLFSTNADLQADGFAPDLLQRLQGETLNVPPLKDHRDDVPLLINYFLEVFEKNSPHDLHQYRFPISVFLKSLVEQPATNNFSTPPKIENPITSVRQLRQRLENLINRSMPIFQDSDFEARTSAIADAIEKVESKGKHPPHPKNLIRKHILWNGQALKSNSSLSDKEGPWHEVLLPFITSGRIREIHKDS